MITFRSLALSAVAVTTGAAVAFFSTQPKIANPAQMHLSWNPGGYSNFVVFSSTDLVNWQTFAVTQQTSLLFSVDAPQKFFSLYGTNSDGDSAWAIK
jgi:hypothetical protein